MSSACFVPPRVWPGRAVGAACPALTAVVLPLGRPGVSPRLGGRHRSAVGLDADGSQTRRCDAQQDATAVVGVAPERVGRWVGLGGVLHDPHLDEPAGEQRGDHLGRSSALERAGQRQQVAVGALCGGGQQNGLGLA